MCYLSYLHKRSIPYLRPLPFSPEMGGRCAGVGRRTKQIRNRYIDISAVFHDNTQTIEAMSTRKTLQKHFPSGCSNKPKKVCLHFKLLRRMQLFWLFVSNFWQFLAISKKSASRLPFSIIEAVFRLDSLQGPQLTANA